MAANNDTQGPSTPDETGTAEQVVETPTLATPEASLPELDAAQNSVKLNLKVQELAEPNAQTDKVFDQCALREKEPPSKTAVLEVIGQYVLDKGLKLETMVVERSITDSEGHIVALDVKAPLEDGTSLLFTYVAEGRHGLNEKRPIESRVTSIEWASQDEMEIPDGGFGNVAEYKDGKWVKSY